MGGNAIEQVFVKGLPESAPRWSGFPTYNFIGGHNDPTLIPVEDLIEATASVLRRDGKKLAMYNLSQGPQGYVGLREFVARKVAERRGIACTADDVLITSGSGQGIDIINRMLVQPGDTVLAEEFSYAGAINKLKKLGASIVGVPLDKDGIRSDALASLLASLKQKGTRPKYIYTIPTIQNPTGSILPLERRHALLKLAKEYGVPIFEDECYADLLWTGVDAPPAIYSLDPSQVVHIGSFSKSLAPALRLGYAVAPWPVLSQMIACKSDSGTGALDQMIVAEYFSEHFGAHVAELSVGLSEKLATMEDALQREFGAGVETWRPRGGIFLWLKLPDTVDVRALVRAAAQAGIAFNPGPEWACDPERATSHLRLCFALPSKDQIREGVAALARVCWEETGFPAQSGNVRHGTG
ncbi:MAG: PLP-dependent aminotransferase family protein [Pseudomonadota bacterium]|nr:PLP-dependent aminotransferase family protein [Pseudomonadota bacterium]